MNIVAPSRVMLRAAIVASITVIGVFAVACGGNGSQAPATATPSLVATASPPASPTAAQTAVELTDVWARATPGLPNENGAVYAVIQNRQAKADRVVSVSVPESIARRAEMHTTIREGDMMKMQQVDGFDLAANSAFTLAPGANHIMLFDLAKQLKAGDTFTISLKLASGSTVESKVEVRNAPATPMPGAMMPSSTPAGAMPR